MTGSCPAHQHHGYGSVQRYTPSCFNRMACCSGGLGSGPHQDIIDLHTVGRSQAVHHSLGNVLRLQALHLLIALAAELLVVVVADEVEFGLHHARRDAAHAQRHLVRPRL